MAADGATRFGELLRAWRASAGLTQEALAERAGISVRAVTDLERGVIRAPRRDTLDMLASALELSAEERREWHELRRQLSTRRARSRPSDPAITPLPQAPNPLIGREREITALVHLIQQPDTRLITVTGSGGVGKTRVALAAAHELAHAFPDGIRYVELAAVRDPALLIPVIAQELGVGEGGEDTIRERLELYLSDRDALLVLDNVEQLRPAASDLAELLAGSPALKLLITSRSGLGLRAEREFPLSPLALPDWDTTPSGEQLERYPAVQLFIQRSRQIIPDFTVNQGNAAAIASICAHLEGLPLAIELAAARVRVLSPEQMLPKLTGQLKLLTGGHQDAPARHRTMRAAVGWSYDLLSAEDQSLLRQLSVFTGGWTLEAAEAVAPPGMDVLDGMNNLVNDNLIRQVGPSGEPMRFNMLETVREFGLEQLDALGEQEDARRRHAHYILELAEMAEPGIKGPDQGKWLARLGDELGNLRAALEWSEGSDVDPAIGLRLGGALSWFWEGRGHVSEGRAWLSRALDRETADPGVRMRALAGAGWLAHIQHDSDAARRLLEESLRTAQEIDDRWTIAWTVHLLGRVAYFEGDAATAREYGQQSMAVSREIGDQWVEAWALHLLALASHIEQDVDTARDLYAQSLRIRQEIGYPEGIGTVTGLLGMLALGEGDHRRALDLFRESLETNRELGARWLVINMIANIVLIAVTDGDPARAARLAGFVEEMSRSVGASPIPIAETAFQKGLAEAKRQLDDQTFDMLSGDGRSMSLNEAIDDALSAGPDTGGDQPEGLTPASEASGETKPNG